VEDFVERIAWTEHPLRLVEKRAERARSCSCRAASSIMMQGPDDSSSWRIYFNSFVLLALLLIWCLRLESVRRQGRHGLFRKLVRQCLLVGMPAASVARICCYKLKQQVAVGCYGVYGMRKGSSPKRVLLGLLGLLVLSSMWVMHSTMLRIHTESASSPFIGAAYTAKESTPVKTAAEQTDAADTAMHLSRNAGLVNTALDETQHEQQETLFQKRLREKSSGTANGAVLQSAPRAGLALHQEEHLPPASEGGGEAAGQAAVEDPNRKALVGMRQEVFDRNSKYEHGVAICLTGPLELFDDIGPSWREYVVQAVPRPDVFLALERFGKIVTYQKELKAVEMMVNIAHGFVEEAKVQNISTYSINDDVKGVDPQVLWSFESIQHVQVRARNMEQHIVPIVDESRTDEYLPPSSQDLQAATQWKLGPSELDTCLSLFYGHERDQRGGEKYKWLVVGSLAFKPMTLPPAFRDLSPATVHTGKESDQSGDIGIVMGHRVPIAQRRLNRDGVAVMRLGYEQALPLPDFVGCSVDVHANCRGIQALKTAIDVMSLSNITTQARGRFQYLNGTDFYVADGLYGPVVGSSGESSNEVWFAGKFDAGHECESRCCSVSACRVAVWVPNVRHGDDEMDSWAGDCYLRQDHKWNELSLGAMRQVMCTQVEGAGMPVVLMLKTISIVDWLVSPGTVGSNGTCSVPMRFFENP